MVPPKSSSLRALSCSRSFCTATAMGVPDEVRWALGGDGVDDCFSAAAAAAGPCDHSRSKAGKGVRAARWISPPPPASPEDLPSATSSTSSSLPVRDAAPAGDDGVGVGVVGPAKMFCSASTSWSSREIVSKTSRSELHEADGARDTCAAILGWYLSF